MATFRHEGLPVSPVINSNLISKILSPAIKLWLRSQVETVEVLNLEIEGKDRQILRGYVPGVALNSEQAVYRGLQLGRVAVRGENIRVNIGQVIKGKPLQILEPIRIEGEVRLFQYHLQNSLTSELLGGAFQELLIAVLEQQGIDEAAAVLKPFEFTWQTIALRPQSFELQGEVIFPTGESQAVCLSASLHCPDPKTLHLDNIQLMGLPTIAQQELKTLQVDLGDDVNIEALHLDEGELRCLGRLFIRP